MLACHVINQKVPCATDVQEALVQSLHATAGMDGTLVGQQPTTAHIHTALLSLHHAVIGSPHVALLPAADQI